MNVFEHAMKMEEDGRNYYLDHARETKIPVLRRILEELAQDELRHYDLFKKMRDNQKTGGSETFGTEIIATTKNVFDILRADAAAVSTSDLGPVSIWEHARQIEKEAEAFYRQQATEVDNDDQKQALIKIADEEHRHYVALDSVIKFLNEPQQWLEDAEWNSFDE